MIMTTPEGPQPPEQPWQDEEDRLADQAGSYDAAHRWMGTAQIRAAEYLATLANQDKFAKKPLSSAKRRRIANAAMGPQYGDEAGVGYPGGKPPEHQNWPPLSKEQAALNHDASQNWRQRAEKAIREGTHVVEED
jgi:hypothetical protein